MPNAPEYYPPANRTAQNFGNGNSTMPGINKLLLHSTESADWPAYGGAGGHPTLTFNPWRHEWRQHLPIRGSATALENAGSFQTNRDHVVQVEIVAYCDRKLANRYGHFIGDMDAKALDQLGKFAGWLHEHYGLALKSSVRWVTYPASYGGANGVRLNVSEFERYRGILGHQHAPGQVHGDPGAINIGAILAAAKADNAGSNADTTATATVAVPVSDSGKDFLDVSDFITKTRTKDQTWRKGDSKIVRLEDSGDISFGFGAGKYLASFRFAIDGLEPGQDFRVQPYYVDTDHQGKAVGKPHNFPTVAIPGTFGSTWGQIVFDRDIDAPKKGLTRRLRLRGGYSGPNPIKVTSVNTTVRKASL